MAENNNNNFFDVGNRLRFLREASGLSQRELARRAAMTNANISQIEHGNISPSLQTLERILTAFPISLLEFFQLNTQVAEPVMHASDQIVWACGGLTLKGFDQTLVGSNALMIGHTQIASGSEFKLDAAIASRHVLGLLQQGELEFVCRGKTHFLISGDGFRLTPHQDHLLVNRSASDAVISLTGYLNKR